VVAGIATSLGDAESNRRMTRLPPGRPDAQVHGRTRPGT